MLSFDNEDFDNVSLYICWLLCCFLEFLESNLMIAESSFGTGFLPSDRKVQSCMPSAPVVWSGKRILKWWHQLYHWQWPLPSLISSWLDICHPTYTSCLRLLVTQASLLPISRRGTVCHLDYDRISAIGSSNDNWTHFCLGLTDHGTLWPFTDLSSEILVLTCLLTYWGVMCCLIMLCV